MITAWEAKHPAGEGHPQENSSSSSMTLKAWTMSSTLEKLGRRESLGSSYSGESLLSMGAMEHLLQVNPEPLRHFSALKDFSGENVAFLTAVAEWKRSYPAAEDSCKEEAIRDAYTRALRIYTDFISIRDADFPINISFQDMGKLESVFEKAARILFGRTGLADHVTPFGAPPMSFPYGASDGEGSHSRMSQTSERPMVGLSPKDSATELRSMVNRISYWGDIPEAFDVDVFDQSEANIKYLVLTNTWPKFVQERRQSDGSLTTLTVEDHPVNSWTASLSRMIACGK